MAEKSIIQAIDRNNTSCFKWDARLKVFGDSAVLPMWVADSDFAAPEEVTRALKARAEHPCYGYHFASEDYWKVVTQWFNSRHGLSIDTTWCHHTLGVMHGVMLALHTVIEKGDKVIIQSPVYHSFARRIRAAGYTLLENRLLETDGQYNMNFEELEKMMKGGAKVLLLCSPQNPIGRIWSREELSAVIALANKYGVYLFCDEIFADLCLWGKPFYGILSFPEIDREKTLMFSSCSKTFNLAGLHFAFVAIPGRAIRTDYCRIEDALGYDTAASAFGLAGSEAAFRFGASWLEAFKRQMEANVVQLEAGLRDRFPEIGFRRPEATFLAWLDFRGVESDPKALQKVLVEKAGLGLNEGSGFGPGGEGFARMNLACTSGNLEKAISGLCRLKSA